MKRIQHGRIFLRSNSFYLQYRVLETIDGQMKRVQRSTFLADKGDQHYETKNGFSSALELLRDAVMLKVNQQPNRNQTKTKIVTFWKETYLPFIEKNLKHSTVHIYKWIWEHNLASHFASTTLQGYQTYDGSKFLTALASKYNRTTLAHVRSLASGIFSHAVNLGLVQTNIWRDVKVLAKVRAPEVTPHYTLEQVETIISALSGHPHSQLIVALSFFAGLRPGEISGLQWGDIDDDYIHIQRSVVLNKVGEPKTASAVRNILLINPIRFLLAKQTGERSGWIFKSEAGTPLAMHNAQNRIIRPVLKKAGITWRGLYAGRRGGATLLTKLTGNALAAYEVLGHSDLSTTTAAYVKQIPTAGADGLRLVEAASASIQ